MDTSSATEIGPRSLMTQIQECWDQQHETDPARAAETIVVRMTKDGASAKEIICDHLGIGTFNPEVVLRAIVAEEYARSLSAEDRLVFGAGLTPLTAQCLLALIDSAAVADEAAEGLMEALTAEDFSVLCRQVREQSSSGRGLMTDATSAAVAMLARMPALDEMLPSANYANYACAHNARTHVLAAMAEHYQECLEDSDAGVGVSLAITRAIVALDEADASASHKAEEKLLGAVVGADFTAMMIQICESGDPQPPKEVAKIMLSRMPALGRAIAGRTNLTVAILGVLALLYERFLATSEIVMAAREDEGDPEGVYQRVDSLALMRDVWLETHEEDAGKAAQEILRRMPEAPFIEQSGFTETFLQAITEGYSAFLARRGVEQREGGEPASTAGDGT